MQSLRARSTTCRSAERQCHHLVFIVTLITNDSLEDAVVPTPFKLAILRPLLTKPSFNKDVWNNSRPLSNLTHMFKVLQKVVALRTSNVSDQGMYMCYQPAYRKYHSTDSALLCIINAMTSATDNNQCTSLVLTDFSLAFETINHDILIRAHVGCCTCG